ncbi:MAG: hypothetical protein ABSF94_18855 [Steroidobacteraceae bacterium]|jgi:hypothetical protein
MIIGAALAATMAIGLGTNRAAAQDLGASCQAPDWNMAAEVATFKSTAENVPAGGAVGSLPPLELGVLYVLKLRPQTEVSYLQASNKKSLVQAPLGGLTSFAVAKPGVYRITVDSPLWIDVVGPAGTIAPSAFTGWHDCRLFRKSVEYTLPGPESYVLQFSEATPELVRVVIEPAKH